MSRDADFILENDDSLDDVGFALATVGYKREGKSRIFVHQDSEFTIDFPKGPLAVGGDYVTETSVLERRDMKLRILTRLDCIRDRLAHFYHWNDYTALNAAVAVAAHHLSDADVVVLRSWTVRESHDLLIKFEEFQRRLKAVR